MVSRRRIIWGMGDGNWGRWWCIKECKEGLDPKHTVVKEGSHVSILVEAVRVMGKDEGIVHMEKGEIGCVGIEWEEE